MWNEQQQKMKCACFPSAFRTFNNLDLTERKKRRGRAPCAFEFTLFNQRPVVILLTDYIYNQLQQWITSTSIHGKKTNDMRCNDHSFAIRH